MLQILAKKTLKHLRELLCVVVEGMLSKLREKEVSVMNMKCKNNVRKCWLIDLVLLNNSYCLYNALKSSKLV